MASSFVITLKSARTDTDAISRWKKASSDARNECRVLEHLFERLASGLESGSFDVQTSANAPVRASGTVTLTYASVLANDTVTIAGTALTCSASTTDATHFKKVTDGPTTATNLATCINTNTTLNKFLLASASSSVVTVTCLVPGTIGNTLTLATSNGTGFVVSAATMASGAGGSETVAVNYSRGL